MDYGTNRRYQRAKLPVQVVRGYNPTEPVKLSSLHPSIDDESIKEGMILKVTTGTVGGQANEVGFAKTVAADAQSDISFFIAQHDGDSHDVQDSGKLVGFDCSDDFEIQTGYFDAEGVPFQLDDALTAGADGVLVKAVTGDYIVGYITKVGNGQLGEILYKGKTPSTTPENATYIQFKTSKNGQTKA